MHIHSVIGLDYAYICLKMQGIDELIMLLHVKAS